MNHLPDSVAGLIDRGFLLRTHERLGPGECLRSRNRRLAALVAGDGRFCICLTASDGRLTGVVASFPPAGRTPGAYFAVMQGDGNFCVYAGSGASSSQGFVWGSLSTAAVGSRFFGMIEEDGNFTVARGAFGEADVAVIWTSRSRVAIPAEPPPPPVVHHALEVGPNVPARGGMSTQTFDPTTMTAPLGEAVLLTAGPDGRGVVTDAEWNVADRAHCLAGYAQSRDAGTPVLFPAPPAAHGSRRPIYGYRAGRYDFTMWYDWDNLRGHHGRQDMDGFFNVAFPAITGAVINTAAVRVTNLGELPRLQLGDPTIPAELGVAYRIRVTAPAGCSGHIAVIQLVQSVRTFDLTRGGAPVVATTNGAWVLDTSLPYSNRTFPIAGGGETLLTLSDSPGAGLRRCCRQVTVNEQFRTYICFRPEPAIEACWMPIGRFDWQWQATIARLPNGAWGPPTGVVAPAGLALLPDPGPPPAWAQNIQTIRAAAEAQFPPEDRGVDLPDCFGWIRRNFAARSFSGVIAVSLIKGIWSLPFLGPYRMSGGNGVRIWTSPADIQSLSKLADLSFLTELPVRDRYVQARNPRQQQIIANATKFDVDVAPQCFFTSSAEDQAVMKQVAPLTLSEVGAALVGIAASRGVSGVTFAVVDHSRVRLTFATPPNTPLLEALAAHVQTNYISVAPEFRFDDPTFPEM